MTRPLHIGIVANTAFNIYNFRLGLIKALQADGHHVVAIAPEDGYVSLIKENDIAFIAVKHLARKGTNPLHDMRLANELRSIYRANELDLVLQYTIKPNIYGTLAAQLTGTKTICTVTGLGFTFLNDTIASKVARKLYKLAFSLADNVLFQNEDDIRIFQDNQLVSAAKVTLVPGSGIDTDHFHPGFCTPEKQSDSLRFLMIGRLLKDKGIYEYASAARQVRQQFPDATFHLLGDIDTDNPSAIRPEELQAWIDSGDIIYHPHTKDTRPFICAADAVVLPSYREGMPRVILEAMAMGKPAITTNAPGCKDAVAHGETGIIVEVANAEALKNGLLQFLQMPVADRKKMGEKARERAEAVFSAKHIHKIYRNLIRNLFA